MPASTGFMSSLPSMDASLSFITSPLCTGVVSFDIHIVPWSIFVGMPASLNSVSMGPGAIPVFISGTTTSMLEVSPPRAAIIILFFPSSMLRRNGDMSVNISMHWPTSSFAIPAMPGMSSPWSAFFATLSFMFTNSTSSLRVLRSGSICAPRTLSSFTSASTLYLFGRLWIC